MLPRLRECRRLLVEAGVSLSDAVDEAEEDTPAYRALEPLMIGLVDRVRHLDGL
jgi:hypothetical protein